MLLGGVGLLLYDWTRNGLPAACGEFDADCFRALTRSGLLPWSGLMLGTIGAIYLASLAIQALAVAFGVGRSDSG